LALVVPVEISGRLIEAVPAVVDKVPPAAERVRREIVLARFLGKLAVDQGLRELRSRLAPPQGDAMSEHPAASPDRATSAPADPEVAVANPHPGPDAAVAPASDTLALADYDHLSSAQVVAKLSGLDAGELDAIETYERSGRHRRTVLGKIDQLRSDGVSS
jgi:hypothetical protein